ncbi:hypothetical protein [Agrobacterium bohemicum]|uniref:Uncharacterized protein n=1 Tax=Agrobacterium bohemicum TaxID=2052828 RepID=A0A135P7K9_9HYPH|nr:hypothetical protein [Agrobacterium bohemicum]KXG87417.1 hypothetical protein ATO67_19075 [Agrobacterium bohemicum]
MLFNLEFDRGDIVEGYMIPDGFSETASIVVTKDDGTELFLPCIHERLAVKQSGRHETGLVGFVIDKTMIEDIESQSRLTIRDAKTGLLIYRRVADDVRNMKLLRLDMSIVPQPKLDSYCGELFQYAISAVERFGHETTLQAFHLNAVESIFISGRLFLRNYEEFLDKGFEVAASFSEPYYEMACRLLTLKGLSRGQITFLGDRDKLNLAPVAEHFSDVNLDDDRAIIQALKTGGDRVREGLSSPVTKQLVSTSLEQRVTRRDVAAAINLMSRFTIVGYGYHRHYQRSLSELLGVKEENIPISAIHPALEKLADRLRTFPVAETFIEEDLILDHYLREAIKRHT